MKILADENIARDLVSWLRTNGHDVLYAAEISAGASDLSWAERAEQENRILFTSDKDFGELAFRDGLSRCSVVLLRLDRVTVPVALVRIQGVFSVIEANATGQFIVITEKKIRVRPLTGPTGDSETP